MKPVYNFRERKYIHLPGCCNKATQAAVASAAAIYCLTLLEAQGAGSIGPFGELERNILFPASFWCFAGDLRHSLACRTVTDLSSSSRDLLCVCVCLCQAIPFKGWQSL